MGADRLARRESQCRARPQHTRGNGRRLAEVRPTRQICWDPGSQYRRRGPPWRRAAWPVSLSAGVVVTKSGWVRLPPLADILSRLSSVENFADDMEIGVISRRSGQRVVWGCGTIVDMRQLQLFTPAVLVEMRDRTAARNYSPVREEFRREHARHRAWGLIQRHGERLRRQRGQSCAHDPAPRGEQVAADLTPPVHESQPAQPEHGSHNDHTQTPRPATPARPAPARVPPHPAAWTPRRHALGPRPQSISHLSKRRRRPSSIIWVEDLANVPRRLVIRWSDRPPKAAGKARASPIHRSVKWGERAPGAAVRTQCHSP